MNLNRTTMTLLACLATLLLIAPVASAKQNGKRSKDRLELRLRDSDSSMRLTARFTSKQTSKGERATFVVKVNHGTPGDVFDVAVNGLFLGQVEMNRKGEGKLRLRSRNLPDMMPSMASGDYLTVGPMGGPLLRRGESVKRANRRAVHRMRVRDHAEDGTGVRVDYRTKVRRDRLRRKLRLSVHDGLENSEYEVFLNGEYFGTITTDAFGDGKITKRSKDADESFPMLVEGDVFTLAGVDLTLQ